MQAYWQLLLRRYRQLQNHSASLHPDAVPLEQSILLPQASRSGGLQGHCCCVGQAHTTSVGNLMPHTLPPLTLLLQVRNVTQRTCQLCKPTPEQLEEQFELELELEAERQAEAARQQQEAEIRARCGQAVAADGSSRGAAAGGTGNATLLLPGRDKAGGSLD